MGLSSACWAWATGSKLGEALFGQVAADQGRELFRQEEAAAQEVGAGQARSVGKEAARLRAISRQQRAGHATRGRLPLGPF